jgi:hypothetical protein
MASRQSKKASSRMKKAAVAVAGLYILVAPAYPAHAAGGIGITSAQNPANPTNVDNPIWDGESGSQSSSPAEESAKRVAGLVILGTTGVLALGGISYSLYDRRERKPKLAPLTVAGASPPPDPRVDLLGVDSLY